MKKKITSIILAFLMIALSTLIYATSEKPTIPSPMPVIQNSPVSGTTYYVNNNENGSDSNTGSQSLPWKTIQKAINTVPNGSTIIVMSGVYPERPVVLASKYNITLKANGVVKVLGFHISRNSGTVIDGFEITATSSTYLNGFGIWVQGSNCVIQNNYIHDTAWGGILLLYYTDNCIVKNNLISGNISQNGIDIRGTNHTIIDNEISDVRQYSPYVSSPPSYADADGMHFHGTGHVIRNNYIHDILYDGVYNKTTHTDCFQTFDGLTEQPKAVNVLIESNRCENIGAITNEILTKGMQVQSATNLIIRNNVFCAAVGMRIATNSTVTLENNVLCSDPTFQANIVSDCIQFESSSGVMNNNTCKDFSSWAVRLDNSPNVSGSGNIANNTRIRSGTEYLFTIPLTSTASQTPTPTRTRTPAFTLTSSRTPTVTFSPSPTLSRTPTFTITPTIIPSSTARVCATLIPVYVGDQFIGNYCP